MTDNISMVDELGLGDTPGPVTSLNQFLNMNDVPGTFNVDKPIQDSTGLEPDELNDGSNKDAILDNTEENTENKANLNVDKDTNEGTDTDKIDGINENKDENVVPVNTGNYKDFLIKLMDSGAIDKIDSFQVGEEEVPLDDMDIDEELFNTIIKEEKQALIDHYKNTTINKEGLSDLTKQLIEVDLAGGDVKEFMETYDSLQAPLNNIDMTTLDGKVSACYMYLEASGVDESLIPDIIESYATKGLLETKSEEAYSVLKSEFDKTILAQKQHALDLQAKEEEAHKEFTRNLNEVLKESIQSDTYRRKIVNTVTHKYEGNKIGLDLIIEEMKGNPLEIADLVQFVFNKEEYLKKNAAKHVEAVNKDIIKKVVTVNRNTSQNILGDSSLERKSTKTFNIKDLR